MLLIIEIALTVWAWMRGWKGFALLPLAIALPVGFVVGFVIGASGGNAQGGAALGIGVFLDLAAIVALVFMIAMPRKSKARMQSQVPPTVATLKTAPPPMAAAPGWYVDPSERHHFRYWSGSSWSDQVSDDGTQTTDATPV